VAELMAKKQPTTPRSRVRASIRQLWLRSRERAAALKRDGYTCQHCGKKQSRAKGKRVNVAVHHLNGIQWEKILDYIYRHVLVDIKHLETVCEECHKKIHDEEKYNDLPF
jgi:5-methylcytosine-specific restriction endonuclease McrA